MCREEILEDIQDIMQTIFDDENLHINYETSRADIEEWDSLSHIRIILSVEKRFNIKFDVDESVLIETVEDFVSAISYYINKE